LVRQPKTAVLGWNQSTNISYPGPQSVNHTLLEFNNKTIYKAMLLYSPQIFMAIC